MPFEYQALAIMTLFFLFAWLPTSVGKWKAFGFKWLASNRYSLPGQELPFWAQRCERAYLNLKDYFPAFVVAVLILGATNQFDECTKWLAGIFVVGRMIHYTAYALGNVPLRALSFFTALFANLFLLVKILF